MQGYIYFINWDKIMKISGIKNLIQHASAVLRVFKRPLWARGNFDAWTQASTRTLKKFSDLYNARHNVFYVQPNLEVFYIQ